MENLSPLDSRKSPHPGAAGSLNHPVPDLGVVLLQVPAHHEQGPGGVGAGGGDVAAGPGAALGVEEAAVCLTGVGAGPALAAGGAVRLGAVEETAETPGGKEGSEGR